MRYLLFGASSAFGCTDYEFGGWQGHLRKYLDTKEKNCYFHNLAVSGDTTFDILRRIEPESRVRLRGKPKEEWTMMISLGSNDACEVNGKSKTDEETFRENVKKIIETAKSLVGEIVVVSNHPVVEEICNPWHGKEMYLNDRIEKYGSIVREIAEAKNVSFIDVYNPLLNQPNREKLTDDGLHPNGEGHKVIFEEVKKFFESK